ncbi:hypothetical protein P872_11135 [Rhodonellum psychrophilum GCM71 = DSM 17998]|uniref:Uncharacterized protein n=1 Tax=Rhodonellum psychrophilum GCM71 = DSM 17998 TaxID=1123057 RepID=U5BSL2_9BACT|nr:hypothetical protein P872_11135 [Rhodonellum psychrophilum GCM71 = DSM 17998]
MGLKGKENQPIGRIFPDTNKVKSKIVSIQLIVNQLQYCLESVMHKTGSKHPQPICKFKFM